MKVPASAQMNERYELLSPIAEGGLGTVFKARDRQTGREVAIKRLRADKSADFGSAVDSLIHEARQQGKLQHPNIVAVLEAGTDEAGGHIVMELVQGETLEDRLGRAPLSNAEFDQLVRQVLAGMSAAHAVGIIHLDLKPENIMLAPQPCGGIQVKILDFGLARAIGPHDGEAEIKQGSLHGSIHFMAPEQFERAEVDARTDIYALGCLFYYALTHRHPFDGDTKPQVMVAHLYHRVIALAELRPDLPAHTIHWIEWLISRQPAERPSSVAEALKAYEKGVLS